MASLDDPVARLYGAERDVGRAGPMLVRPLLHRQPVTVSTYTPEFFARRQDRAHQSADAVVPHLTQLFEPSSVIDVGCGTGAWLTSFAAAGVADLFGVDGTWVDPQSLTFDPARFMAADLSAPLEIGRRFDLVLSLELAEHLPPAAASTFVASLTRLGSVIVFSAAIPNQGGTGHVNEQWPSYWIGMFRDHGYTFVDCLRPALWNDTRVAFWYVQNTLVFVDADAGDRERRILERCRAHTSEHLPVDVVHPRMFEHANKVFVAQKRAMAPSALTTGTLIGELPRALARSVKHRLTTKPQ